MRSTYAANKKAKQAREQGIPALHVIWMVYSILYLAPLSEAVFSFTDLTPEQVKNIQEFQETIYQSHPHR